VLAQLSRADLRPDIVAEKLLPTLQSALAAMVDDVDKESVIRALIERRILSDFPKEMPIDGRDIIKLGVKGAAVGQILVQLRAAYLNNNLSRELLLVQAKEIIAGLRPEAI
jgi:hypothetical protein